MPAPTIPRPTPEPETTLPPPAYPWQKRAGRWGNLMAIPDAVRFVGSVFIGWLRFIGNFRDPANLPEYALSLAGGERGIPGFNRWTPIVWRAKLRRMAYWHSYLDTAPGLLRWLHSLGWSPFGWYEFRLPDTFAQAQELTALAIAEPFDEEPGDTDSGVIYVVRADGINYRWTGAIWQSQADDATTGNTAAELNALSAEQLSELLPASLLAVRGDATTHAMIESLHATNVRLDWTQI